MRAAARVTNPLHRGHLVVLHDRPPAHFKRTSLTDMHDVRLHGLIQPIASHFWQLFARLTPLIPDSVQSFLPNYTHPSSTPFTWLQPPSSDLLTLRPDRPALVITSTSWTPDEDFDMLFHALRVYEKRVKRQPKTGLNTLPKVLMIVTGKGPLRDAYMEKVTKLQMDEQWEFVRCVSLWLEATDYPLLLGEPGLFTAGDRH